MRTQRRNRLWCALVSLAACLAPFAASAQCTGKPAFEDSFRTLEPTWGPVGSVAGVEKGWFLIKARPGYQQTFLNRSDFFGDGNICVAMKIVESAQINATNGGISFWGLDNDNHYSVRIGPGGTGAAFSGKGALQVARLVKNRWLYPVSWTPFEAFKLGMGDVNAIEVRLRGRRAAVFVNGQEVVQFNGAPPDGGSLIGLNATSPDGISPAVVAFQNLQFFSRSQ